MTTSKEAEDLVACLDMHRSLLRQTVRGITEEQGAQRTSVSELHLAGIIKHVAEVEARWAQFIVDGTGPSGGFDQEAMQAHAESFRLLEGETLEGVLADYESIARRTDQLIASVDLEEAHPLPAAPWFEPGATWTNRATVLHILAETAQHAGHADIIREGIDGARTMG